MMQPQSFNMAAYLYPIIAKDVFDRLALFGYPLGGDAPPSDLTRAIIHRVYYEQRCAAIGLRPDPWDEPPQPRPRYERVM
jgi:hypothetical protein